MVIMASGNWDSNHDRKPRIPFSCVLLVDDVDIDVNDGEVSVDNENVDIGVCIR